MVIDFECRLTFLQAVKSFGIKDCHIQMQTLSVDIQYDHSRSAPVATCNGACDTSNGMFHSTLCSPPPGYITRRAYVITLEKNNLDLLEKVIAAGLTNGASTSPRSPLRSLTEGANRLSNFTSNVTNLSKAKQEIQRVAVRAARAKAELMAGELGMKVGPALHIEELDQHHGGHQTFAAGYASGGHSGGSMPLGNVTVSAAVKVDFQLLP